MGEYGLGGYPGVLPPPPGETVDLANPESMAGRLVLTCVICPVFALAFGMLRLYTARFIVRRMYLDDWLIVVSLVFAILYSALNIVQTRNGAGIHIWNVTPAQLRQFVIVGMPASVSYNLATLFAKSSILFFYLRFAAANRPFRIAAYAVLCIVVGYSLTAGFSFLYLCSPICKLWDFSVEGFCVDIYAAYFSAAVLNSATDVILLLLPAWLIWPLRVPWRQKLAVGLVLMPGGFVCGVSIIRLAAIPAGKDDTDTTWRYCLNLVWCLVEMYVGIICACLPCLKVFTKHHFPRAFHIEPQRASHERVNFSIFSAIPTHLRTLRRRPQGAAPPEVDLNTASQAKESSGVSSVPTRVEPEGAEPVESPGLGEGGSGSKSSAGDVHARAMDQASMV